MGSLLAIDVGKRNLHMAQGNFSKNVISVEKVADFPVPEGVFSGEIADNPGLLSEAIVKAVKTFGFNTKDAVITFDAYGAVIRDIELPAAKPKETDSMIKTEMVQTYHVEPDDVVQYKIIGKTTSTDGLPMIKYRVAAITREIVESYHNALTGANLKPVAMDININAMDKLFSEDVIINDKLLGEEAVMLIEFGDILTTVYIISKGEPIFFRQLDSGSSEIEKIVSETTLESEEDLKKMKEEGYNFFGTEDGEGKYAAILRPFFYNLSDEIRKVIGFYTSRSGAGNISQIFLSGGGSKMTGFPEYCENNFNVPAEHIVSISNIKLKDTATPIASYINAIGALIRY